MKVHHITIVGFFLCSSMLQAQTLKDELTYELSGSVFYSYSSETWGPSRYEVFEMFRHTHRISFRPGIGYFICPNLEVILEPHYDYSFLQYNGSMYLGPGNYEEIVLDRWTHNAGLSFGPSFHYWLNEHAAIFAAMKGGVSWTYIGSSPRDLRIGSPWKKPEISFPIIDVGAKVLVNSNWAGTFQIEYSRTTNYSGYDDHTISVIAAGLGLAVFL
jgi:hypothetical protein